MPLFDNYFKNYFLFFGIKKQENTFDNQKTFFYFLFFKIEKKVSLNNIF